MTERSHARLKEMLPRVLSKLNVSYNQSITVLMPGRSHARPTDMPPHVLSKLNVI
jgi:hypothetical protein